MPVLTSAAALTGGTTADSFLHVQTKRAGKIKGEAVNPGQTDDIIVRGWRWGLEASSAVVSMNEERRSYTALTVYKDIDRATTGLMSALATNDEVKEAKLTLRRAGGVQEVFFKVTLENGRIAALSHETDAEGYPREAVSIVFTKVTVEYSPQQSSGLRSGSTTFTDEIRKS